MITLSCHCKQIELKVPAPPADLGMCNCSICSKTGVLWAYYNVQDVELNFQAEHLDSYIWGDKMLRFCRCNNCGCPTHWEGITQEPIDRMGVNARLMEGVDLDRIPIRRIDGASY